MARLTRTLSLPLVIGYGLGTILGAGIYGIIGKVAEQSLIYTPLAFLLASISAIFTAISYAQLSAQYPQSGGAAVYVNKVFHNKWFSALIGWSVLFTGIISAATLAHAFVGYFKIFFIVSDWLVISILIVCLGIIACFKVRTSTTFASVITLLEVGGLLIIIFMGGDSFVKLWQKPDLLIPPFNSSIWLGIFNGAFLAFYAYIGFEDMVNIAEEIKSPKCLLPLAIILSIGITTILYILIACVVVLSLPINILASSEAPLASVVINKGHSPVIISIIGLLAVINGALIQKIMGSRLIYGMAKIGTAPKYFLNISLTTKTPIRATIFTTLTILGFAWLFPMITLAKITNFIVLCIFAVINLTLLVIKLRTKKAKAKMAAILPAMGLLLSLVFLSIEIFA